jgi:hypothetical protein
LLGVGEALKREIAGVVWADQLRLWGFEFGDGFISDLSGYVRGACVLGFTTGFAALPTICAACQRFWQLLRQRVLDLHKTTGLRAV